MDTYTQAITPKRRHRGLEEKLSTHRFRYLKSVSLSIRTDLRRGCARRALFKIAYPMLLSQNGGSFCR